MDTSDNVHQMPPPAPERYWLHHDQRVLEVETETAGMTRTARLFVDGEQADEKSAELEPVELMGPDVTVRVNWSLFGDVTQCALVLGDGEDPDRIDFEPPEGSRAARINEFGRRHPRIYASRHVVKAVAGVLIGLVGIGAMLRGLLPRFDLPSIPVPDFLLTVRDLAERVPDPLGWVFLQVRQMIDITLPDWVMTIVRAAPYWIPILIAVGVALAEIERRRQAAECSGAQGERSGGDRAIMPEQQEPEMKESHRMTKANVVVIGGGVNGTSTAFHLAKMGMKDVVLVERRQLGAGATGKSGALVRMHYTNPFESKLAYESLKIFRNWTEEVGGEAVFEGTGFVQIAPPGYEDALVQNVQDQQEIGIDTRVISKEDLKELVPEMRVDNIGAAAYEASSGWADPNATTYAFAEAARQLGVRIETFCEATRIVTENDGVVGVETTNGRIETDTVVIAPGAWASRLLEPLGLDFGLAPRRVQLVIFHWPPGFQGPHPVVSDTVSRAWLRPEGHRSTLIGAEHSVEYLEPEDFTEVITPEIVEHARQTLTNRFPAFENATMRGGWSGMYTMSPDHRPIIDQIPSVGGLYCMIGDSGTSFKTGPAIGKCLAEWIINGEPQTADLTPFRSTRFAEGKPWSDGRRYGDERLQTISR